MSTVVLKKEKLFHVYGYRRLTMVKMVILPKLMHGLNIMPIES